MKRATTSFPAGSTPDFDWQSMTNWSRFSIHLFICCVSDQHRGTTQISGEAMTEHWIKCQVSDGPMARELVVVVQGIEGPREVWVAKEDVSYPGELGQGPASGKLRVRVVDRSADRQLVELPGEVPSGTRLIWVPNSAAA
jgi:hypothetical protein